MTSYLEERCQEAAAEYGMTEPEFLALVERETEGMTASECVELAFPLIELEPEPLDTRALWGGPPDGGYRVEPTGGARNVRFASGAGRNTRFGGMTAHRP
jgi:hypothetical protein